MSGNETGIRPFLMELSSSAFKAAAHEILYGLPKKERSKLLTDCGVDEVNFYRVFDEGSARDFVEKVRTFVERVRQFNYRGHLLMANDDWCLPYQLLIHAVYGLGRIRSDRDKKLSSGHQARGAVERCTLERAIHVIGELAGSSCVTSYYWNRQLNRTSLFWHDGLHYPEAMYGISWKHNAPRRVLFSDDWTNDYPCRGRMVSIADLNDSGGSGFVLREGIIQCWAVQLRWHSARVAVFLSWRNGETPAWGGALRKVSRRATRSLPVRLEDMELALLYLNGWLGYANIDLSGDMDALVLHPAGILEKVGRLVQMHTDLTQSGELLKDAVKHTLSDVAAKRRCSVHWVTDRSTPEGKLRVVKFEQGEYEITSDQPAFPLVGEREFVKMKGSVSAQAASWEAPILIRDLDRTIGHSKNSLTWRAVSVSRKGWMARSEIAVPIKLGDSVRAVINVEHEERRRLTKEHVRRVELVGHLFSRVWESKSRDGDDASFVHSLVEEGHIPNDGTELLRRYVQWVRDRMKADVVYILVYEYSWRVFRPGAVATSDEFLRVFLEREFNVNCGKGKTFAEMRPVMVDALSHRLFPRRRGRTWTVFTTLQPAAIKRVKEAEPPPSPFSLKYFGDGSILGVPFLTEVNAQPDGVVWVRWMSEPSGLRDNPNYLDQQLASRLRAVQEVVATMYAVYRYCGLDEETVRRKDSLHSIPSR